MFSVEVYDHRWGLSNVTNSVNTQPLVFHIIRDKYALTYLIDETIFLLVIKKCM
jgi:hypothetical protein